MDRKGVLSFVIPAAAGTQGTPAKAGGKGVIASEVLKSSYDSRVSG